MSQNGGSKGPKPAFFKGLGSKCFILASKCFVLASKSVILASKCTILASKLWFARPKWQIWASKGSPARIWRKTARLPLSRIKNSSKKIRPSFWKIWFPKLSECFTMATFNGKMVNFSFKMRNFRFKMHHFSFKLFHFSSKMFQFAFKTVICRLKMANFELPKGPPARIWWKTARLPLSRIKNSSKKIRLSFWKIWPPKPSKCSKCFYFSFKMFHFSVKLLHFSFKMATLSFKMVICRLKMAIFELPKGPRPGFGGKRPVCL